jgi:hypothetical protein
MEYMIVEADKITTLVQRVQGFLDRGWSVSGGPFAVTTYLYDSGPPIIQYAQALIKQKPVDLSQRRGSVVLKL